MHLQPPASELESTEGSCPGADEAAGCELLEATVLDQLRGPVLPPSDVLESIDGHDELETLRPRRQPRLHTELGWEGLARTTANHGGVVGGVEGPGTGVDAAQG